jgi:hypothetical protein
MIIDSSSLQVAARGAFSPRRQSRFRRPLAICASALASALVTAAGAVHASGPSLSIGHTQWGPVVVYGSGWAIPSDVQVQAFDYYTGQLITSHTVRNPGTTCNAKGYCYTTSFKTSFSIDEIGSGRYASCSWLRIHAKSVTGPLIQAGTTYALFDCIN